MNEDEFIGEHAQGDAEPAAIEQEEGPKLTATEQTAYDQGWRPEEDFEGKEGNWKTAKEYINHGEFIGQINDLKRQVNAQKTDFDERLDNTNKLNEARRKSEINDLKKAQREAVEMGDTDAYDKSQDKIDNLEKQPEAAPATPGKDPAIAAWEAKNAWIDDPTDEKASIAQGIFSNYSNKNPNCTAQQALDHVDARLGKLYPTNNPRRDQPDANETPTRKSRQKGRELSMNDLTQDEQSEWNKYGSMMFKDQKSFLKAVADTRKKS